MFAVLWTLVCPARKKQKKHFIPLGPKPSTELPALAVLTTVHRTRTAGVGSSDPGYFHGSELLPSAVLMPLFKTAIYGWCTQVRRGSEALGSWQGRQCL